MPRISCTWRQGTRLSVGVVVAAALTLAACGGGGGDKARTGSGSASGSGSGSGSAQPGAVDTKYDVTYTDGTKVIEPERLTDRLISASDDGRTFRFRPTEELRSLKPGQVAILGGVGFGRVSAVREEGGVLVVETAEANLGEAIKDGTISWKYHVNWSQLPEKSFQAAAGTMASAFVEHAARQAGMTVPLGGFGPVVLAAAHRPVEQAAGSSDLGIKEGLNYNGSVKGWKIDVSLKPAADRLNLELQASRPLVKGKAVVGAKGWVTGFTQETFLSYENSTPTQLSTKALGVETELELTWKELGGALTDVTSFKLPVTLPIPFMVGPLPVVLKVTGNLQVVPQIGSDNAFSTGSYKVKYRSDQGFEINGTSRPFGELLSKDIGVSGDTLSGSTDNSFTGITAFALGLEFPRLELSILGTTSAFMTIKTYSTSQWSPGTVLSADYPPCQKGTTMLAAYAGYSLKLLGFKLGEKTEEVWKTEYKKYKDNKPCD